MRFSTAAALVATALLLSPQLGIACDEEVDVQVELNAAAKAIAEQAARIVESKKALRELGVKLELKEKTLIAIQKALVSPHVKSCGGTVIAPTPAAPPLPPSPVHAEPSKRPNWSPGHLIEPDSIRLGPEDNTKQQNPQEWVTISSRDGVFQIKKHATLPKKAKGRVS